MAGTKRLQDSWADTDNADNATATATKAAETNKTHYITSVSGGFGSTVSGNTLILKDGSTEVARWYVYDTFAMVFPSPIELTEGNAANLELEASGTGGVTGAATLTGYTAVW